MSETQIVYIIYEEGSDRRYKIGETEYLDKRIKDLQKGNPKLLSLHKYYEVPIEWKCEKYLHHRYHERKMLGEWFLLEKSHLDKINEDITGRIKTGKKPNDNIKEKTFIYFVKRSYYEENYSYIKIIQTPKLNIVSTLQTSNSTKLELYCCISLEKKNKFILTPIYNNIALRKAAGDNWYRFSNKEIRNGAVDSIVERIKNEIGKKCKVGFVGKKKKSIVSKKIRPKSNVNSSKMPLKPIVVLYFIMFASFAYMLKYIVPLYPILCSLCYA